MSRRFRPPVLARRLLQWGIPSAQQEFLLGDLEEEACRHERRSGGAAARIWYWKQTLAALAALAGPGKRPGTSTFRHRGEVVMQTLHQDLRFGLRQVVKNPVFSLIAVLTLALGIGSNTAIFSVISGVLLEPLPYRQPSTLVKIWNHWPDFPRGSISVPEYEDFRQGLPGLQQIGLHNVRGLNLSAGDGPPEARRRELAVRGALGAGGLRLAGQLLSESLVLSTLGGISGVLIAFGAVSWLRTLNPPGIPRLQTVAVDERALALTLLLTLLSALLFGLAPARRAWGLDVSEALREQGRRWEWSGPSGWVKRWRDCSSASTPSILPRCWECWPSCCCRRCWPDCARRGGP
ncbi:MAG TPA: FtsX-like permease family protein [Acidobacteriota bacterium]|nr:FtsX-like permease family protein [Acidobacteriota bacterium]